MRHGIWFVFVLNTAGNARQKADHSGPNHASLVAMALNGNLRLPMSLRQRTRLIHDTGGEGISARLLTFTVAFLPFLPCNESDSADDGEECRQNP